MLWLPQMKEADKSGAGLDPVEVLASHKTPNVNPTQRYYSLTQILKWSYVSSTLMNGQMFSGL